MSDTTGERLLADLGESIRPVVLDTGEILVREGDDDDAVFVVVSGSLVATTPTPTGSARVGQVGAGQVVGEVSVVVGGRRIATLAAVEPTEVAVVDRSAFERWLRDRPEVADAVAAEARERIDRVQLVSMFASVLGVSDKALIEELLQRVEWRRLEAGQLLFEQGDASDAAYFVVGGRVVVTMAEPDGSQLRVRELARGEVVGELGLLDRAPRSATVRAVRDTTLARFSAQVFEQVVARHPQLMLAVARSLLTRLDSGGRRRPAERGTAIVLAVTSPVADDDFVDRVAEEVRRFGSVRLLSSEGVDRFLRADGIAQVAVDNASVPRLAEFLHEAEVSNDHVIFVPDQRITPWTRRTLRQADRVVIVTSPRPDPEERQRIEALVAHLPERLRMHRMLAVLHPPGTDRPRSTRALVDVIDADEVVHVRRGSDADLGRLARLASGHGVGLVLSGGGARGFAHLGVYRALNEAGVPVDAVGACSIGAPLGAGIALGLVGDELLEIVERQFHRLLDYTVPVVAMLKGERISRRISESLDGYGFEDLWLPYYCVSTNLTQSRLEVHRSGDLARAVRASVAIPGVLPPVPFGDDLLVDGGVLNNLPVEAMRDDPTIGTVIAVDVAPPSGPRAKADFGLSVSGPRALIASARRQRTYPSASAVLMRSMLVGAVRNQEEALRSGTVDLLVRLTLPGVSLLQFDAVRPVAQSGFDGSIDTVRGWAAAAGWSAPDPKPAR